MAEKKKGWLERDSDPIARFINDLKYDRVGLYRIWYHGTNKRYEQFYTRVPRKDLPMNALTLEGKRNTYLIHSFQTNTLLFPENGEVTAVDYYRFAVDTSREKALSSSDRPTSNISMKKLAIGLACAVFVAIYLAWVML